MRASSLIVAAGILLLTSVPAPAAPKAPVAISNVRAQIQEGFGDEGGHRYAIVTFDATFNVKPPSGHRLNVKALCKVDGRTLVATADVQDTLADADAGLTKPGLYASPFISETLPAVPSSCDLTIGFGKLFDKKPKPLGQYCWKGLTVTAGRCPA